MSAFLDKDELTTLTGFANTPSQKKWLEKNGWIFSVNAKGIPVVGRDYCNSRLSGGYIAKNDQMPDFSKVA